MKKHLLALVILGAFASAAPAQSNVTLYGTVDAGLIKRTDQRVAVGKRANNTLGFRGTEDLGNGLKALVHLEIRYEPDTGTNEIGANGAQRPLFQGQSRVGLQGAFGMVRLGRGLTALQESIIKFEPFHGLPHTAGFYTDLAIAGYTSEPLNMAGNSKNRFSNALWYNSPEVGGFQLNATISTREANGGPAVVGRGTPALPQYPANAQASTNPYSISATFKRGPAAFMAAMERNAVETDLWSVAASWYVIPSLNLMASYQRQDEEHTRLFNQETRAWVVGLNWTLGPGKLLAGFGRKKPDGLPSTRQLSIGYEYSLSKRTYLYADASNKKNQTDARYYAVGINHAF
jgi:predicted porin